MILLNTEDSVKKPLFSYANWNFSEEMQRHIQNAKSSNSITGSEYASGKSKRNKMIRVIRVGNGVAFYTRLKLVYRVNLPYLNYMVNI